VAALRSYKTHFSERVKLYRNLPMEWLRGKAEQLDESVLLGARRDERNRRKTGASCVVLGRGCRPLVKIL